MGPAIIRPVAVSDPTVHELANFIRGYLQETLPPGDFAKKLDDLNTQLSFSNPRVLKVLQIMTQDPTGWELEFGCLWLDTYGYGDRSMKWLSRVLARGRRDTDRAAAKRVLQPG